MPLLTLYAVINGASHNDTKHKTSFSVKNANQSFVCGCSWLYGNYIRELARSIHLNIYAQELGRGTW